MLPPLVERELRVALLRRNARKQWLSATWTAAGISFVFMLLLGLGSSRSTGRTLFYCLLGFAILGVVRRGFALTADLFSEERRNGTLGLVVLTGLQPLEIFSGKLLGALFIAAYTLLGALPFFSIPFLAGGVPAYQFLCSLAFLTNALLFCVAIGLLGSIVHREAGQAQLTAQGIAVLLCGTTPLVFWLRLLANGTRAVADPLLSLSPAYAGYLLFRGFTAGSSHAFWVSSGMTLCYSLAALLLAGLMLQRNWREGPGTDAGKNGARWRAWFRGSQRWRKRVRRRLLGDEPFCWLAARDRTPVLAGYAVVAVAAGIWLAGWAIAGSAWISPLNAFISSIVLHQALNLVGDYAAGRLFAEERNSGGFEILLTAPLNTREIVEGQSKALLVQFRGVALITLLLDGLFCWSGLRGLNWTLLGMSVYLSAWVLMLGLWFAMHLTSATRAMWIATWTGRPSYAALKAAGGQWSVWFWLWIFSHRSWGAFLAGDPSHLALMGLLILPILLTFSRRFVIRQKLIRELRLIATAPIPARGDKKFQNWEPEKIFPPDPLGQLAEFAPRNRRRKSKQLQGRMDALNG